MVASSVVASRLGRALLDLVFPPRCASCGRWGGFICSDCEASLRPAQQPRCDCCWQPQRESGRCEPCASLPSALDGVRAAFIYEGTARSLVHALKYRSITAAATRMAGHLVEAAKQHNVDANIVVPVPLSGVRRRLRGYNQADLLGRPLAFELGIPFEPRALRRRRHSAPQARTADAEARRSNVAEAFECSTSRRVAGQRVLLVDDVTTTGATLAECAAALKGAGARAVWGLAFARED